MIRSDVDIRLDEIEPAAARAAIDAHQLSLDWSGDDFLAQHWLGGTQRAVLVDGQTGRARRCGTTRCSAC